MFCSMFAYGTNIEGKTADVEVIKSDLKKASKRAARNGMVVMSQRVSTYTLVIAHPKQFFQPNQIWTFITVT